MNSSVTLLLFSTLAVTTGAMTTTHCETCFTYSTQMLGPIDLPSLDQESTAQRNVSLSTDEVTYTLPSEIMAQLPSELAELIASADPTPERYVDKSLRFYPTYSEDNTCSSKSAKAFESWEESFDSLEDCCEAMFSWDIDTCLLR